MLSIKVYYHGQLVGVVSEQPNSRYCVFRYDDNFIESGIELCPLLMPLNHNNYLFKNLSFDSFRGLPPLLADSLPDKYGSDLLFAYQKMFGKTSLTSLEALSYIGKRGMGALEFVPSIKQSELNKEEIIEIDSLVKVANQVLFHREKLNYRLENANLRQLISVGSSIGGARAKAIVAIDQKGNIKSGQIAGLKNHEYCIIKFDGLTADLSEEENITYYTRIEYAYYLMAKDCGINISDSSLIKLNGKYHFKTRRFDRDENGNKIHMLSLAGIAGYDFKEAGSYSYEDVALIIERLNHRYDDLKQLFLRMVFNVVCKNHDDHVKNISFLLDKSNKFVLSPAYDLTYSYNPFGEWTKHHQMSINGKVDEFVKKDLLEAGSAMFLNKHDIEDSISKVLNSAQKFKEFAKEAELPEEVINSIYENFNFLK